LKRDIIIIVVAAMLAGCDQDDDLARMVRQRRVETFSDTDAFADGRSLRPPVEGAVRRPRGPAVPGPRLASGEWRSEVPLALDEPLLERGRERFEIICATCHGVLGDGGTIVAARMRLRPPPSLLSPKVRAMASGEIEDVIERGTGLMPALAAQLGATDRWAVVAYLRALQLSRGARLDELPPALRDEARRALGGGRRVE
jgi:mono/diheme cytochrome c family protein